MDRDRGALWRIAGNDATSTELVGKERPFEAKKVGGVAWMGDGRLAVGNTRNDLLAVIDAQGNAERVFGGGGGGHGELDDPEGLAFSVHRRLYVADQGNNRVAVYSETGVFLHSIGAGREPATALVKPFQVALDGLNASTCWSRPAAAASRSTTATARCSSGSRRKRCRARRTGAGARSPPT